ncbi:vinorine synthase-like [Hibiscus syriacus]|uniref:vinorine synthase-like n=1 Tax=Hibiscus syriacus TaxID=106335 RepID=UPI0019203CEE|nr:vinorine synthase-like [Hibiscus syriacus]
MKFVDILDHLYINVPFLEAIDQMLIYVKFLKDIVIKKRKIEKYETIAITKECYFVLSKLPPKRKDPGSFLITHSIGDNYMERALCDHRFSLSASKVFPPRNEVPKYYLSTKENLWFPESNNYITKRFTFDAESINDLRAIAKCDLGVQTLSGFIWKCFIAASWTILASSKPSIVVKAVDLRPRMNPPLLHNSIGNLFWWASCIADIADETSTELFELVRLMRESVEALDDEFLNSLHGEQGFEAIGDLINQLEAMFSFEKPDILVFTSWCNFRIYEIDLGWGKPEWVTTPFGEVGYDFRNLILFARRKCGKGIEAWLTLDEKRIFFVGERY